MGICSISKNKCNGVRLGSKLESMCIFGINALDIYYGILFSAQRRNMDLGKLQLSSLVASASWL